MDCYISGLTYLVFVTAKKVHLTLLLKLIIMKSQKGVIMTDIEGLEVSANLFRLFPAQCLCLDILY